uniref:Ribosomal protein L34 n=1 Tax=Gloeochaete wittrockiana TaxID=38269 RepID=A0A3G1IVP5_9EUKA|nr:ribosomal protein L34 [Gloeochaete wittrockiana]YP_009546108.1 ribosomal protein L34 [Gloeochaete wittrockiana]ASQ40128.1 ribosomal protein L34 [Gloeochaete wittrockiana]ASQ40169.1 ribosomal protein L34 [Gloeochaete wittrockiana]
MTKRTLRGTRRKKIRTSGFRKRLLSSAGKRVLKSRRKKNRNRLA